MEKYSAFRDPGTGIQPFLTPVPPNAPTVLANVLIPVRYLIGFVRITLLLLVTVVYVLLVEIGMKVFYPIPSLYRVLSRTLKAFLVRLALVLIGLWWIPVALVPRNRGKRGASTKTGWKPQPGDVIVSNWSSWIEILWLGSRFNPVFVLPITGPVTKSSLQSGPISGTPRGRTGVSSAMTSLVTRSPSIRAPILGYRTVSLLNMVRSTGYVARFSDQSDSPRSLESIRKDASGPVVVFPECTASNGRALLRFAEVFGESAIPIKDFNVFVMCVRYDPPTLHTPTLTCPIPSPSWFSPLPHIFQVASSLYPLSHTISFRLLDTADSPSSRSFLASDVLTGGISKDKLTEACSALIAQMGKMKTTGLGWEDKVAFMEFHRSKTGK